MSRASVIAKRYAKAMFEIARERGVVSEVEEQLRVIAEAIEHDADIRKFLSFPNIEAQRKVEVIRQALGGKVSDEVLQLIALLIKRGRQEDIPGVFEAYTRIAGETTGEARAVVYTAMPLGDAELASIAEQFGKITGKTIRAEQQVDPSLLGGIRVRIGDRLYDGSLSGKLARLEKALNS
jgi:F-type H+-transporting ATPase subunit delta